MENNWSQQLIDMKHSFWTKTFLHNLIFLAILSPKPASVLCRFYVQSATLVKDPKPPCHKLVVLELIDTQRIDSQPLLLFLECGVSTSRPPLDYFSSHPDYATVRNNYLPDLAGRSMGILVSKVEEAVVSIVASYFLKYKEEKRTKVLFIIDSDDNC